MGSPSIPAQPAAPDYAAANREGIVTDISTLPLRRQVENAARLGQSITYIDPSTGEQKTADFSGTGDADYAKLMAQIAGQTNAQAQRDQLALRQELGTANARQTAAEIAAADPSAYNLRNSLTNKAQGELDLGAVNITPSQQVLGSEQRLRQMAEQSPTYDPSGMNRLQTQAGANDGRLGDIYNQASRLPGEVSDATTGVLNQGLQQALAEYKLGGKLDDASRRDLENEVRAGQAARGNYLGDAAAVVEATELGKAGAALKQQRLQNLLDIQNRAFGQNTTLRQEGTSNLQNRVQTMAGLQGQDFGQNQSRIGQQASLMGQNFNQGQSAYQTGLNAAQAQMGAAQQRAGEERTSRQEGFGFDQQRFANAQAVGLGAPITNQFGSLGGAQNGAVAYNPVNFQGGTGLNQNAGQQAASFAQGNYGTQANMWNTSANIAAQGNPWMSLAGKAVGSAAGAGMAAAI